MIRFKRHIQRKISWQSIIIFGVSSARGHFPSGTTGDKDDDDDYGDFFWHHP